MTDQRSNILGKCRQLDLEGKMDESIKLLTVSIARSPSAILYYERGWRFEEIGEYKIAKADYTQAIQDEPLSKYLIARGLLLSNRLSDHRSALRDFEHARTIDPQNLNAHINLALCNLILGELSDAFKNAEAAIDLAPNDALAHFCLGHCLLAANRPSDAAEELKIATTLDPTLANYWCIRSRALRKADNLAEAEQCLERAIELERSAGNLISYAGLLLDLNEPLHAITVLQEVQRMDLTEAQGLLVEGFLANGNRMLGSDPGRPV